MHLINSMPTKTITKKEEITTKTSQPEMVDDFMKKLKHPLKDVSESLRQVILETDNTIGEEIYWNAPSFFYTGKMKPFKPKEYKRHMVVFNLFKKDCIRLIFLRASDIDSELLEGDYTDGRRIASFYHIEDVISKKKDLKKIIKTWLKTLDKN